MSDNDVWKYCVCVCVFLDRTEQKKKKKIIINRKSYGAFYDTVVVENSPRKKNQNVGRKSPGIIPSREKAAGEKI